MTLAPRHIALQFGHIKHFNEGLAEFSRQLAMQYAQQAGALKAERNWHFHFIMPKQWHGMFGHEVQYHDLHDGMRLRHRFPVDLDVWHGLHQHMRFRPPVNSRRNIITVHDLNHVYAKKGLSLWWQNMRLTRQLRRAHQLVAISQYAADDLRKHLPWAPPAVVIYNGVADLSNTPQQPVEALVGKPYLLHISRMSPSKNVASILALAAHWPEKKFVLAGPQSAEVDGHKLHVARMNLQNVMFFTDVTEHQKAWLYQHCEAFIFPSLTEGFGLPPIEAMRFGHPVVTSDRTSLPEVCGPYAHYLHGFDASTMRSAIESAISNAETDSKGRSAFLSRYDWANAAEQYLSLYRGLLTWAQS